jgi:hypothetical protein
MFNGLLYSFEILFKLDRQKYKITENLLISICWFLSKEMDFFEFLGNICKLKCLK